MGEVKLIDKTTARSSLLSWAEHVFAQKDDVLPREPVVTDEKLKVQGHRVSKLLEAVRQLRVVISDWEEAKGIVATMIDGMVVCGEV